jgi:hypothetical protein
MNPLTGCRIAAVVAFALFVVGAAWNANVVRDASAYGFCYVLKDGIFAGAAVLALVTTALGLASYVMLRGQPASAAAAAKAGVEQPAADGISMGQAQLPHAATATPPSGEAPTRMPPPAPPAQGGYGAQASSQQQQFPSAPPAQGYQAQVQYYPPPQGHEQV